MQNKSYAEMNETEKKEYRLACARKGGKKRAKAFTREYQIAARAKVSSESCKRNGHKGFVATLEKHGAQKAQTYAAQYRIEHPSQPEQWLIDQLNDAELRYQREVVLPDGRSLDFVLTDMYAIEMNGHQAKACFGEVTARSDKHVAKVEYAESLGYHVFVFDWLGNRREQLYQLGDFIPFNSGMLKEDLPF